MGDNPLQRFNDGTNLIFWLVNNEKNSPEVLEKFLEEPYQLNPNFISRANGYTPLHQAKRIEHIALLLKYGANVNAINGAGKAPLCRWCAGNYEGDAQKIRFFLESGANPFGTSPLNDPFHHFAFSSHFDHISARNHMSDHLLSLTQLFFERGGVMSDEICHRFIHSQIYRRNPSFKAFIHEKATLLQSVTINLHSVNPSGSCSVM